MKKRSKETETDMISKNLEYSTKSSAVMGCVLETKIKNQRVIAPQIDQAANKSSKNYCFVKVTAKPLRRAKFPLFATVLDDPILIYCV